MALDHEPRPARLSPRRRKLLLGCMAHYLLKDQSSLLTPALSVLKPPLSTPHISERADYAPPLSLLTMSLLNTASKTSPQPEQGGERITRRYLAMLGREDCKWAFRFTAEELLVLAEVLELPDPLITERGYRASTLESIALLCAHLRSPDTQWALVAKYGRPQSAISEIINETAAYINDKWAHLLDWDAAGLVHPVRLREYSCALRDFGAPCGTIFGFIDCTIRPTCRPGEFQELVYTGYKKCHGMKYQAVVMPNGLIAHLAGPFRAPQNDMGVLAESNLIRTLEQYAIQPGSSPDDPPQQRYYQIYGDSAYGVSPVMVSPYSGIIHPTPEQRAWNTAMGGIRISVEHGFGLVLQDWPQLHCFWRQRIWGTQCGVMYCVGVLLTNARACLVPNQTSRRYACDPPTLEEYFHAG